MKKASVFLLLFISTFVIVYGQDDKLKTIRASYTEVNDNISKSKMPDPAAGGLYSTELVVNSNNGSWRAVGNYSNKIVFWYNDQPGHQADQTKPDNSVLLKIEITTTAAIWLTTEEYLYKDGKLVFYYKTDNQGEDGANQEFRYYFWDGKLFRYQKNQEVVKDISQIGVKDILNKSLYLQKLFIQTFN
jgi:hypothetical protein